MGYKLITYKAYPMLFQGGLAVNTPSICEKDKFLSKNKHFLKKTKI